MTHVLVHAAELGSMRILASVGLAVLLVTACSSDGEPPEGLATLDPVVPTTTTTTLSPEQRVLNERVRTDIRAATAALLSHESVSVELRGAEDGYELTGSVEVDLTTGDYRSTELETYESGSAVRSDHTLVGDILYVRFDQGDDGTDKPFTPVEIVADRQEFVDEALTMAGRAGGSLDRVVRYLDEIPFNSIELEANPVTRAVGYQASFRAADVAGFLRDNDLEQVGPRDPAGLTVYEFWIDSEGVLIRVALGGVHFQDGEALEGFGGELRYSPGGVVTIAAPDAP